GFRERLGPSDAEALVTLEAFGIAVDAFDVIPEAQQMRVAVLARDANDVAVDRARVRGEIPFARRDRSEQNMFVACAVNGARGKRLHRCRRLPHFRLAVTEGTGED